MAYSAIAVGHRDGKSLGAAIDTWVASSSFLVGGDFAYYISHYRSITSIYFAISIKI